MAPGADDAAAPYGRRPPARPRGRLARHGRARGSDDRALARGGGPLTRRELRERLDGGEPAHRGPGARAPALPRRSPRRCGARADDRPPARIRARPRLARRAAARRPRHGARRSSRGVTSPATARPPTAISRAGPGCRSATRARAWARSRPRSSSARRRLVDLAGRAPAAPLPPPRLLGAFEPFLLGWRSREEVLGEHESAVVSGGLFRPFALVRGRAVATGRSAAARSSSRRSRASRRPTPRRSRPTPPTCRGSSPAVPSWAMPRIVADAIRGSVVGLNPVGSLTVTRSR